MNSGYWSRNAIALLSLAGVLALATFLLVKRPSNRTFAFVDTGRLLTSFKDAHRVNKEVEVEDLKWKAAFKVMEDSLKAFMDTMTVRYDLADFKTKREMQDELAVRNQQVTNFQRVNTGKMQEISREKLAKVYEKIDAFMKEFGKSHGYDVVFGTSQGSILYGEGTAADITDEVIEELNRRYE